MIPDGFRVAPFSGSYLVANGPFYTRRDGDSWQVGLRVEPHHVNYVEIAHGGILSTLADVALSNLVYLSEDPHPVVTTTSLTTNFLSAARLGDWLVARASIDRMGKRTAHVHGQICRDDEPVATMSGVFGIYRPD